MKCIICGELINSDRREALEVLGKTDNPTCLTHADNSRRKAIFQGLSGVSPMLFVDKVSDEKSVWHEKEEKELTDFSYNMTEE